MRQMMNETILYTLAVSLLILTDIGLIGLGFIIARQKFSAMKSEIPQPSPAAESAALSFSILNEQIARIEADIKQLSNQQTQQAVTNKMADSKAYEVATKLVHKGASVEELINICGITRGEAELIRTLHSGSNTADRHDMNHVS